MTAVLALEDGRTFTGRSAGAPGERSGEVVFNTGMTGYGEILTDPSYRGQLVTLTTSHVGNYGIHPRDLEAGRPWAEALITRAFTDRPSNWRAQGSLGDLLREHDVMAVTDLDTRALTRHIRERGAMRGVLSTETADLEALVNKARGIPPMEGLDLASGAGTSEPYEWTEGTPEAFQPSGARASDNGWSDAQPHVVVIDFGVKRNTLRRLVDLGARVSVVPGGTRADDVLVRAPDGVLLSNGPGDPAALRGGLELARGLLGRVPLFGICLGHQLLGRALGARTMKLPFGHHGGNHPVRDVRSGAVRITAQNHGFAVDADSLPDEVELLEVSGNDGTCQAFRHRVLPVFGVQYHPEAGPGPHDGDAHFGAFFELMRRKTAKTQRTAWEP